LQELFETVRAGCTRAGWSQGVELARGGGVVIEGRGTDEIVLRVAGDRGLVSPTVVLHPKDPAWECDCGGADDPCAHVAAAVIALRRAEQGGPALPTPERRGGRLRYELRRQGSGLAFERILVREDGEETLTGTLAALAAREGRASFVASQADLAVEHALGSRLRGAMPRGLLRGLLRALARCDEVRLDGSIVRVSAERARFVVRVVDDPIGFRLLLGREPAVTEDLGDGVVLCGDTLRELASSGLTGRELAELPAGRSIAPEEVTRLVTEILPDLRKRVEVRVETGRLPATRREVPRIVLRIDRDGDGLAVLPTLVYGSPPAARVDAGRLIPLRGAIPLRDEAAEQRLVRELRQRLELVPGHKVLLADAEAARLVARLEDFPAEVQGAGHHAFVAAPPLVPVLGAGDRFDLRFESREPDGTARGSVDGQRVLEAFQDGRSGVLLPGGGFAPLPADWLARLGPRIQDLLAARDAEGSLPACVLPDLARLCDALDVPRPPGFARLAQLVEDFTGIPAAPLPADLRATLRGYQRTGVDWLVFLRDAGLGGLLADDMGLGKTLEALCAVRGRTLVVCPTSVLHGWADEIRRFRPGLAVCVYHGPGRALDPAADVTLTTYALLRIDQDRLAAESFESVVLDEAQAIKNADSQVARAAFRLRGRFRLALTGTPVENRLDELWSQLHFTNPGLLGDRSDFESRTARAVAAGDPGATERLRERIRPFVLRRRKRDVAPELPPRQEVVLRCTLTPEERSVYEAVRAATRREVVERLSGGGVIEALEALLRLRQACCHPALVPGHKRAVGRKAAKPPRSEPQASEVETGSSSKLDLLLERLDTALAEGHKALVFSQWTSLLDLLEPGLRTAAIDFARLDGSTRDRPAVLRRFADEAGPPVLLLSLKAGGTGLNLVAADHVFLLDPWWNPAAEDQAADRAHRIGQTRPVLVHRLVAEDTVEERILALQERKRGLAEAVVGEGGGASLSREDLLALLA
jgi:superfamily II DNA or RNA helicase